MLSSFMARAKIRNWTRDRKVPGPMGLAAIGAAALFALFQLSGHNYLLSHTLVELWALAQLAEKLQHQTGISITTSLEPDLVPPSRLHAYHLYRIAQEVLLNAIRHSSADKITLTWGRENRYSVPKPLNPTAVIYEKNCTYLPPLK